MEVTVLQKKLQYDVLRAVSKPGLSMSNFKMEILEILNAELGLSSLKFFDYRISHYGDERKVAPNPITLNMPVSFWDEDWINYHYKSFLYNPNHHSVEAKLHNAEKEYCIMKIVDLMTLEEYENSANYKEVIQPSGYYYSLIIYFRDGEKLISSIAMARAKEDGDFTEDEIELLDSVCPFINKRLVEYDRERSYSGYLRLISDVFGISMNGLIMLDDKMQLMACNDLAKKICSGCFASEKDPIKKAAWLVAHHARFNESQFTVRSSDGTGVQFNVTPYYSGDQNGGVAAYLVSILGEYKPMNAKEKLENKAAELTGRQKEIIELVAAGKTNKEIAEIMYISENTVRKHVENIRVKLGAKNRIAILKQLDLLAS